MNPKQIIGTALEAIFQESDEPEGAVSEIYLVGALHYLTLSEREREEMEKSPATVPPMDEVRVFWENTGSEKVVPSPQDARTRRP